jgi:hypothetical protein
VLLVVPGVRGVVGRDRVDGAVGQRLPQRVDVLLRAQRRVDLVGRVVAGEQVGGEQQVVRRDLGGHVDALGLGPAQDLDGAGGRGVGDVHAGAGVAGQHDVARHDDLLGDARPAGQPETARELPLVAARGGAGQRGVLGVLGDDAAECLDVLQGATHDPRVMDALAVVGEDPDAGARPGHQAELGELLAGEPAGDGTDRLHVDQPGLAAEVEDPERRLGGVGHR